MSAMIPSPPLDASASRRGLVSTAAQQFIGAKRGSITVLTSSANSLAINLAANNDYSHQLTENTTLAAPSNVVAGQSGVITFTQDSTPRTLGFNSFWKFAGGAVPTLSTAAGAVDVLAYQVLTSGMAVCSLIKDVK